MAKKAEEKDEKTIKSGKCPYCGGKLITIGNSYYCNKCNEVFIKNG